MKINEKNYIQQLRKRNELALMYVVDQYSDLLYAVIRKHLYYFPHLQEECLNDVLLGIWLHIDAFDEKKSSFKNWIAAIAKYQAIDYLKKYRKELSHISLDAQPEECLVLPSQVGIPEQALEEEISKGIQELLSCLNEKDKELFQRLYINEASVEEVSKEMQMNKSVLYNRVSRAKKKIRQFHLLKGGSRNEQ